MAEPIRTLSKIYDVNKRNYQSIPLIVDTGATASLIPTQRLLDLGYDLANAPRIKPETANGPVSMLCITLTKMTVLEKSAEQIEVTCYEPEANMHKPLEILGLLGMNFLCQFDNLNISFLRGAVKAVALT
jgi:predicted aspartyl protease